MNKAPAPLGESASTIVPFAVTKKEAQRIAGSQRLVQRWLYWTRNAASPEDVWLQLFVEGGPGRQTLINYASLIRACERAQRGEWPPLLPSERRTRI